MLSIILPVLNEGEALRDHLLALQPLRGASCELIGVDGGSTDNSLALLQQHCDQALSANKGRALQMNAGAAIARGQQLVFLHADSLLPDNAENLIQQALGRADWGRFNVQFDCSSSIYKIIATAMNWRSRLSQVCTGDQALFFKRDFFIALDGYPPIALMEDVALCKAAKLRGRFIALDARVTTSARRWQNNGVLKTILLMWELRLRYFLGQSPSSLARRYNA